MCNLVFKCYHNKGTSILLKVDGNDVMCINSGTVSTSHFTLEEGNHKITIIKNSIIYKWYWWLNIFNFIYVLLLYRNRAGGRLGYDDNFASCTLDISVTDNEKAILEADLYKKEYNKNGRQGSYFLWSNIKGQNIIIQNIIKNEMQKYLLRRWRIIYGLPTFFYCILIYIVLTIKIINKELAFDYSVLLIILISAFYSIYILISVFKEKSVEENLKVFKKEASYQRHKK